MKSWYPVFFLVVLFVTPLPILAGQETGFARDSLLAIQYFNIADTSWKNVDTCIHYNHLAIPLLKKTRQWDKYVYCLAGLSYCYRTKEYYDSLEINNRLAYLEAQKYLSPESPVYIAVINNLGKVYSDVRQDYNQAIAHYETALTSFDSTNLHFAVKGTVLKNMGDVYLKKGDFDRAILHFKEALTHFEAAYRSYVHQNTNAYFKIAEVYQSLARVHQYQGEYEEAVRYLEEMLALMNRNPGGFNTAYFVYCYTQLAEIALEQDRNSDAAAYLQRATRLKELTPQQGAETDRLFSCFYLEEGDWSAAHRSADRALELMPATKRTDRAAIFHTKGQILYRQARYPEALAAFTAAVYQLMPDGAISMDSSSFGAKPRILSRLDLVDQLQGIAHCYMALYEQHRQPPSLRKALNCFLLISEVSDQLRQNYQSEESKIFLNETTHPFYEEGIAVAYQLYQLSGDPVYLDRAFYLFEKSKAVVLLEEIRAKEAAGIFTIPSALIEEAYQLRVDINYYRKMLDREAWKGAQAEEEKAKEWNSRLLALVRRRKQLEKQIQDDYPNYMALTQSEAPGISSMQADLPAGTAAVAYFLGRARSFAFFLTEGKAELRELPGGDTLRQQVRALLAQLKMDGPDGPAAFKRLAHPLFQELLGPFDLSGIDKLLLVPDGGLAYLPFEILLPVLSDERSPRQFDYLLRRYQVSYAYSLALWQLQQKEAQAKGKVLVVAPVFRDDPGRYLRHSDEEIAAFASIRHTVLKSRQATVAGFLQNAPDYDLLYFSTHATAGDSLDGQPAIDFYDQSLLLSDLYTLNLPTHLVVLSACETGIGGQRRGEGVMSLARGFTYAGVPSVVTTLWKVNEKATSTVVDNFYRHLRAGLEKDEALRRAKLDYLEYCEDIRATPYFWASFVVIGNTRPFEFEKERKWSRLALLLLLPALLYFLARSFISRASGKK